ncbi:glycosyltransferase [Microbacterium tenebrionis]|uniref:glycosyltransferase n=1 Tax=Microbacterium tenebrionis TaxID=2830665 RepID=UPI00158A2FF6|nr:glycosyltransferase [Microbacterium ihumii]
MSPQNTTPTVSVVVPVYNVERYLRECLESVSQQDYDNWSAIVVIDGSPDDSERIAREFAENDPRFHVISVPNGGLGSARNIGFKESDGEYVFWLDSDDVLPPSALSTLVEAAVETKSDIVAGYAEDFGATAFPTRYWTQNTALFDAQQTVTALSDPRVLDDHVVWNKLYRRSLLAENSIDFPEGIHCEDMVFSARAAFAANRTTITPRLVYRHRRHDAAISASYTRAKTLADWLEQSTIAIGVVSNSGNAQTLDHYLSRFVSTQWWTRARAVNEITDPHLMSGLAALSAAVYAQLSPTASRRLRTLESATLRFFAEDDPRQLLDQSDPLKPTVLMDDYGRSLQEAVAALNTASRLAAGSVAARRLAEILWIDRALQPAADGWFNGTDGFFEAVDALIASLGLSELRARMVPGRSHPANTARFLLEAGRPLSELTSVQRIGGGIQLRGVSRMTPGIEHARTGTITLHASADARPAVRPITWTSDGERIRWQAVFPYGEINRDTPIGMTIHFAKDGEPRGSGTVTLSDSIRPDARGQKGSLYFAPSVVSRSPAERRIFTIPAWRDNPFVTIMQLATTARGYVHDRASDLDRIVAELTAPGQRGTVHLHWPDAILDHATSEKNADSRVDTFLNALAKCRSHGRAIIWTLHNALPHDHPYHAAAVRLHQGVADLASTVHLLNSHSLTALEHGYDILPEKTVHIPHPSYAGVYGAPMERTQARALLGVSESATAVLHFGQLRPYKGVEALISGMRTAASTGAEFELLLAGKPKHEWARTLSDQVEGINAILSLKHIPDEEVPHWFSASDVLVLPYRRILNSGTMHLAAPFSLPTILPAEPHLVEEFGEQKWIRFFDLDRPEESIAELLVDPWYKAPQARLAALAYCEETLPVTISRQFARLVESLTH